MIDEMLYVAVICQKIIKQINQIRCELIKVQ